MRLPCALLLALLPHALGQNEAPTSSADGGAPASSTSSATTLSTPPPLTTSSLPSPSATFTPYPAPSALHVRGALADTVYAAAPRAPLPVSDPASGPWLLPDYEDAWDAAFARAQAFVRPAPVSAAPR
jgi:hypothetical protein